MTTKNIAILFLALLASVGFWACKKDQVEQPAPAEQELITTVKLNISDADGFNKEFSYTVQNGFETPTPGAVTKDSIILEANKEYDVAVQLLNENEQPAEDITLEVIAEKEEHLFLYEYTPLAGSDGVSFKDGDKDANDLPFNQKIKFVTQGSGTGILTITLKHVPTDKEASSPMLAGGETDMEASFDVQIR